MPLATLKIEHLRNIEQAAVEFSPGINLIVGPNASGKTSLLEAIALLTQGRSFRTTRIDQLITHGQSSLTVVANLIAGNRPHTLGISRQHKKTQVRLDGTNLNRSTDLIDLVPLHVITPESHEILDQGPKMRRQYLDWGVFHVKQDYLAIWQRYHRILRQRNQVLRQGGSEKALQAWEPALLAEANQLHQMREAYLEALSPALSQFGKQLLDCEVEFRYRPGWSADCGTYQAQLQHDLEKDRERGFTHSGPHRADIALRSGGHHINQVFSRGQQKLIICAMYLAQVAHSPKPGILLIDDLPAELDPDRRQRLLSAAAETGAQLFMTATEASLIPLQAWEAKKMFHVEHGKFREVV
ncbi:MAG: DNA replication/repair protein RecF [Gammaproteobacteria bacterium]